MYELTVEAFNLADRYRNPVVILGDGYLGQMMEAVEFGMKSQLKRETRIGLQPVMVESVFITNHFNLYRSECS